MFLTISILHSKHMKDFSISQPELIPYKIITVVGGATLPCLGYINAEFSVEGTTTKQKLYFCDKIDRIFFSKNACIATFILPSTYPKPLQALKCLRRVKPHSINLLSHINPMPWQSTLHTATNAFLERAIVDYLNNVQRDTFPTC